MSEKIKCLVIHKYGKKTNMRAIRTEDDRFICYAELKPMSEYVRQCLHEGNPYAALVKNYVRAHNGKDAILWEDRYTLEKFITY